MGKRHLFSTATVRPEYPSCHLLIATESETNLLQFLVVLDDKQILLFRRPSHNSAEKWDALLHRNRLGGDSQVEAMLDKPICAMSSVFIGASGSTFSEDIIRLLRGWESASQCNEYLCQGELSNFIAEMSEDRRPAAC